MELFKTDSIVIGDALNEDDVVNTAVEVVCEGTVQYLNECNVHGIHDKSACTYAAVNCAKKSGQALSMCTL